MPTAGPVGSYSQESPYLPQELIDSCFDFLVNDKTTLRKCLSVSPTTLAASRRHLFRAVDIKPSCWLSPSRTEQICDKFRAFWETSRHLLRYVKVLVVETNLNHRRLREDLTTLFTGCELEEFRFSLMLSGTDEGWEDVSHFLTTWSTWSLVTLELENINYFPYDFLRSFPNLKVLRFCPGHNIATPAQISENIHQETLPPKGCIALCELQISDCIDEPTWFHLARCIDYSSLRKVVIIHRSDTVQPQIEAFLDCAAPYIEDLVWRPPHILVTEQAASYPALQLGRFTKLRTLELRGPHLLTWESDRNVVKWICNTLTTLPINSPLENLVLDFPFRDLYSITPSRQTYFCPYPHASGRCTISPSVEPTSGRARRHFAQLDRKLLRLVNLKRVYFASHEREVRVFGEMRARGKLVITRRDICWGEAAFAFWDECTRSSG
ncbi:hypothetical protein BDN72DRAFT_877982 [Pluteus cervinus]|uniref:Uncharacterized protein n=1 Tax=Pluteus cervinus TaxID=181527 RepID=A0ACD3AXN6_9AGAR|nr:hypothetical protein BDN72DRAFT_877982 [Pluteus cervinus]